MIYRVTLVDGRAVEQPHLTHTLVKKVRVDIFEVVMHPVLFGIDFVGPTMIAKFDY